MSPSFPPSGESPNSEPNPSEPAVKSSNVEVSVSSRGSLSPEQRSRIRQSAQDSRSTFKRENAAIEIDEAQLAPQWNGLQGIALASGVTVIIGGILQNPWIGFPAAAIALASTFLALWNPFTYMLITWVPKRYRQFIIPGFVLLTGLVGASYFTTLTLPKAIGIGPINWEAFGALAELFGAVGQIMVAFLALFVAWRQYVISKELTTQQNRITQQQTIDAYFQGISDLILDEEGLLEDWPPERAIAEGRTASILTGLNAEGKAKIIRFLSSAKLLTPLKRDRRLGRPIFDGLGGYEEDIEYGVRVIDLGSMLANADLSVTDLRNTDLSDANLVNADLENCDFHRANLARSILFGADLSGADLYRVRLFYGTADQAKPRDRIHPPNYATGAYTGAVVENADFTGVKNMTEEQRTYCCAWGGDTTRGTIPGGCEGIPNKLV